MKTRFVLVLLLIAGWLFAGSAPAAGAPPAAVEAARAWLSLVDNGEFAKSWREAAAYFRGAVSRDDWVRALNGTRRPLGGLLSRKLKSAVYATALPGAPDGEYVVIQFATGFTNKQAAVETVTPMKDSDGVWRVSGYFIK